MVSVNINRIVADAREVSKKCSEIMAETPSEMHAKYQALKDKAEEVVMHLTKDNVDMDILKTVYPKYMKLKDSILI